MSSIRSVNDGDWWNRIFRGGKMEKKKIGKAKEVEKEINTLKDKVGALFENRGYYKTSEMLILDIVELIMDCQNEAVEEALNKLTKRLFKEKKK